MIISVTSEDGPRILRLNNFTFAGVQLSISPYDGSSRLQERRDTEPSQAAVETRQRLTEALSRRYDLSTKLLDLSALAKDPELVHMGTFNSASTISKIFSVLMVICDERFSDPKQKREAILSVSLANNDLRNISIVSLLASTFPDLKNLDLSNNKFEHMSAFNGWRGQFRSLDHLVLTGNPIERVESDYQDEVLKWFPSLRILNGVQVRSDQEVAAFADTRRKGTKGKTPLHVAPAVFDDEGQVAENFLKQFFTAFDGDRNGLVDRYYDLQSTFSLNVNTSAPRAQPSTTHPGGGGDDTKRQMWDPYIKRSRNLSKITHLPARLSRAHVGTSEIRQCWATLPATRHPSLFDEPHKWLLECHPIPGLPDPTRRFPAGLGGLMIVVHGEFDEMNVATGQAIIKRSFDRTFILGPNGASGIRVLSDLLTYRAYGGFEAWIPEDTKATTAIASSSSAASSQLMKDPSQMQIPAGVGMAGEDKSPEVVQQELMVIEMSKRTGMTLAYSKMCLDETAYSFDAALAAFEKVKVGV